MNVLYTIRESPHHWLILAGLTFLAGMLGAMAMLAWAWPHPLARVWLLAGIFLAAYFLLRAALEYFQEIEIEE